MRTNQAAVFSIALLVAALFAACTTETPSTTSSSTGTGGAGGSGGKESSSSSTSTSSTGGGDGGGGAGGDGGTAGAGGAGGGSNPARGHTGTEVVSGGKYMKSDKYRMIYTIGQPSQIQSTVKSDKYRMQGGIVGATGSLK